jgi:hypothetical protein
MKLMDSATDQPKNDEAERIVQDESLKMDEPISLAAKTKNVEIGKDLSSGDQISSAGLLVV